MFRPRKIIGVLALVATVALLLWLAYDWGSALWGGPNPRISRETTFITEPLDENGYVDYVAAINKKLGEGITPESNAAVLFWRTMGPEKIDESHRQEYFALLGIEPLPVEGDYFRPISEFTDGLASYKDRATGKWRDPAYEYLSDFAALEKMCERAAQHPWEESDWPIVAEWLAANEVAADRLIEATRQPHWYTPISKGPEFDPASMQMILLPEADAMRSAHYLLPARAMRKLRAGDHEGAWNDAMAQLVLAQKSANTFGAIGLLLAVRPEESALLTLEAIAMNPEVTAQEARAWLASLEDLPAQRGLAERIGFEERFVFLALHLGDHETLGVDNGRAETNPTKRTWYGRNYVDWNRVLPRINQGFDRLEQIHRLPTWQERVAARPKFEAENVATRGRISLSRRGRENTLANIWGMLLPAFDSTDQRIENVHMRLELLRIALAVRIYQLETGKLPDDLQQLVPQYLPKLPHDRFTGEPLRYLIDGNEFAVYSLGPSLIDRGGRVLGDEPGDREDNIVIRTPGWVDEEAAIEGEHPK